MANDKIISFMKKGAEISGGAIGSAIGLIGGPAGAIAGGGLGVIATQLLTEIVERSMSNRQQVRVAATSTFIFDGVNRRLIAGEIIRTDDFFEQKIFERSKAEELFEGVLLKCSNQFQEKKIKFISKIFEHTIFDETISTETANQILTIANSLTYRKLCLISFYGRRASDFPTEILMRDVYTWYPQIVFSTNEKLLIQDLYELINMDILDNHNMLMPNNKSIYPDKLTLTEIGSTLYQVMNLNEIDNEDIKPAIEELKYKPEWGKSTNETINGERNT